VHLVLKPAYASKGLPSGEVKVGLVSMAVMAITGSVLTYYKVSTPQPIALIQFWHPPSFKNQHLHHHGVIRSVCRFFHRTKIEKEEIVAD